MKSSRKLVARSSNHAAPLPAAGVGAGHDIVSLHLRSAYPLGDGCLMCIFLTFNTFKFRRGSSGCWRVNLVHLEMLLRCRLLFTCLESGWGITSNKGVAVRVGFAAGLQIVNYNI